jgi:glycine cleavage system H protein
MEEIIVANKYRVPLDRKYTKEHEWCLIKEGNKAVVGITDYAQQELGDIVYVELPPVGEEIEQNDTLATVESVKSVAQVYSPVSGKIIEVNKELEDSPDLINEYPYEDGWIAVIEMNDPTEEEDLLSPEEYAKYLESLVEEEEEEEGGLTEFDEEF